MAFYDDILNNVTDPMITQFGTTAVHRVPDISGDEANPTFGTPSDYTIKILKTSFMQKNIDGDLIQRGDMEFLAVPDSDNPDIEIGHTIIYNSDSYQVINPDRVEPAVTNVLWKLHVRK